MIHALSDGKGNAASLRGNEDGDTRSGAGGQYTNRSNNRLDHISTRVLNRNGLATTTLEAFLCGIQPLLRVTCH